MTAPSDFLGREIKVGDFVLKIRFSSNHPGMEKKRVTSIVDGVVKLNDSHVPIQYPHRLVILPPELCQ